MWSDRIQFRAWLCPHIVASVTADEQWGTAHRYTLRCWCETCGPVIYEERRAAYAG